MGKFCGNCGMQLEDDSRICGNCGTPYVVDNMLGNKRNVKKKFKKIAIISLVCTLVIAIGIFSLNVFLYINSFERAIDTFVEGINEYNLDEIFSVSYEAKVFQYDDTTDYENTFIQSISDSLDSYENQVGHDPVVSYEIVDSYKLSDRKLQSLISNIETVYNYDASDISEVVCVSINLKIEGPKGETSVPSKDIYVIKENGKWYFSLGSITDNESTSSLNENFKTLFN